MGVGTMIPIRDTIPSRHIPFATWALIIVNVLLFINQVSMPDVQFAKFVYQYGFIPARFLKSIASFGLFEAGTYFPLFSSMFLHGN